MKKSAVRLGLYITDERDRSFGGDYYHVRASVVVIGLDAHEMRNIDQGIHRSEPVKADRIRNVSDEPIHGLALNNLQVTSQGNSDDTTRHLYGFDVEFRNVFSVDARKAAAMHKTLTTIDKRMATVTEKYGNPATFGAYLARVAQAIGADAFVLPSNDPPAKSWTYDNIAHRILTVADGIYHVDGRVRAWVNERELKTESA